MRNPIARALIPLVLWLLMLTLPPTGRHRTTRPAAPRHAAAQRRRRRTLWLATVGVDLDRRNIHAGAPR
ncbi:hypothetical protein [Streptomyces sp. NRRL F-5727]|uniref:hypothetical protein n=1 Tax=Streptomyces sp. NRRL F-5727 TaxID=1463871 RepID=UPI0004CC7866|nr:hypothetical protein [Streptomyces sp. NRRL F-5727]